VPTVRAVFRVSLGQLLPARYAVLTTVSKTHVNWYMVASTLEKHSALVFRDKQSVFLDYLTLKMEELYSSCMLITVYQLTQCHITEGLNLQTFYVSNLYNIFIF